MQLALRGGAAVPVGAARNDSNERENGSETQGTRMPEAKREGWGCFGHTCRLHGHVEVRESGNRRLVGWEHRAVRANKSRECREGAVWPLTHTVHTGHAVTDPETPYSRAGNTRTSSASVGPRSVKGGRAGGHRGMGRLHQPGPARQKSSIK